MSSTDASTSSTLSIHVKGPQDVKLTLGVPSGATVLELKQLITDQKSDFPVDSQRLIYSGKVLKDEELISKYNLKDGHSIHLVKGAPKTGPSGPPGSSAAAGVPSNFAAGQQVMGNPLAPLMNAEYAGQLGGFNPFAQMGVNPNDPNYMQTMMQDPAVQQQMQTMLSDPAVLDQVFAQHPELQAMGPQARQMMESPMFRQMITNPQMMQQAAQMMGGGAAGAGAGSFPPPGAFGFGSGANAAGQTGTGAATSPPAAGAAGQFNPFAALGGGAGTTAGAQGQNMPDFASMMAAMGGGGGGFGGFGGAAAPSGPQIPPEERFQEQLAQMNGMGFYDAAKNIRALQATGGNVHAAVEYLFSMP